MILVKTDLKLSVYDFDGTVYDGDSFVDFWWFTIKEKPLGLIFLPYQLSAMMLYYAKLLSPQKLKEKLLLQILLFDRDKLDTHVNAFWRSHIVNINPWVRDGLRKDREDGLRVILISASPSFILHSISETLGFDTLIATDFCVINGRQTHRLASPNCKGAEKVVRLQNWADSASATFTVEKVYSDSQSDLPLYELASQKFCVRKGVLTQGVA